MDTAVRVASRADIPIIRGIALATWPIAYRDILSTVQLAYMLERMYSETALLEQFEQGHVFLIATKGDKGIGFTSYGTHHQGKSVTRIHKLYVLPDHQRMGLAGVLLDRIATAARLAGDATLNLNVNRFNKATDFYLKNGFHIVRDEVIDIGSGFVMDDHVMERSTMIVR